MKSRNGKNKNKIIFLIVLTVVVAAVLVLCAIRYYDSLENAVVVRTDTTWLIIVLLAILPIFLIALAIASLVGKNTVKVVGVRTDGNAPRADAKETKDEEEKPNETIRRFCLLPEIDERAESYKRDDYVETLTLAKLCDEFREFAAYKLKLYYDISDIRRFIAGLAVTKIIILQGMSGTGKTSLAYAFGQFLDNPSTVIPVQPMWKERTDLLGYYNEFTKRFNETDLLVKMYEALYSKDIYITVLDEMNIARVEYYFAEFLSLLELPNEKERYLTVVSDGWQTDPLKMKDGKINLPPNMWFIGTANNDDSTFAISDKVYDRAMVLNLDKKSEPFKGKKTNKRHIAAEEFKRLTAEAEKEYVLTKRNEKRLETLDKYLIEHFHITFGNRIMKQIRSYVPIYVGCGGEELEALDDILSKKIMRKLEMQNPVHVKRSADDLCAYLDELFGDGAMPLCKEYVLRLKNNA